MDGEKGMEVRYCICKHCGNIVEKVKDKGVPVICWEACTCIYGRRQSCSCRGRRDKTSNAWRTFHWVDYIKYKPGNIQKTVKSRSGAGSGFLPLRWGICRRSIRILQSSWVLEMLKTLDIRAKITKRFRYNSNICCVLIYL